MAEGIAPGYRVLLITQDVNLAKQFCRAIALTPLRCRLVRSRRRMDMQREGRTCDVVLLDEALGAVDNWNLAHQLREAAGDRVIAVLGLVSRMDMERVGSATNLGLEGFIKKSSIDARTVEGLQLLARKVQPPRGPIDRDYLAPPQFMTLLEALASPVLREPTSGSDEPTARIETSDQSKDTVLLTSDPTKQTDAGDTKQEDLFWLEAAGQPPDLAGTMLGKVRLDKKIGSGSGGAVYRGTHTNLDLPVAVKVLHAELAALDSEYAMAFLLEARTAARVNHANVVRVLDCDRDEAGSGAYYIVMEYVVGNSLEEEIRLHGSIHEERLTGIAIGVSHALVAAHDAEIVHRDIKPANILLDRNDIVKLADLGLAKRGRPMEGLAARRHLESHSARQRKELERMGRDTKEIAVQGTPYYMAPE